MSNHPPNWVKIYIFWFSIKQELLCIVRNTRWARSPELFKNSFNPLWFPYWVLLPALEDILFLSAPDIVTCCGCYRGWTQDGYVSRRWNILTKRVMLLSSLCHQMSTEKFLNYSITNFSFNEKWLLRFLHIVKLSLSPSLLLALNHNMKHKIEICKGISQLLPED